MNSGGVSEWGQLLDAAQVAVELGAFDAQQPCGLGDIALALRHGALDQQRFGFLSDQTGQRCVRSNPRHADGVYRILTMSLPSGVSSN